MVGEKPFRVNGCRTAGTRRRDGLPINPVHAITRSEHARHAGVRSLLADDVTVLSHFDLSLEQFRARNVANGDENAGGTVIACPPGLDILQIAHR